jgi:hypothetical protein
VTPGNNTGPSWFETEDVIVAAADGGNDGMLKAGIPVLIVGPDANPSISGVIPKTAGA